MISELAPVGSSEGLKTPQFSFYINININIPFTYYLHPLHALYI